MPWELKDDRPIYLQLVEHIELQIISGVYQAGDKLPSVRDLAMDASVNPNTMQKALAELEQKGLVFAQRTAGRFITEDINMITTLKNQQAIERISAFFEQMQKFGMTNQEIILLIEDFIKER